MRGKPVKAAKYGQFKGDLWGARVRYQGESAKRKKKRFRADAPNQNTRFQDPDLRAQNDPESATVCRKMG